VEYRLAYHPAVLREDVPNLSNAVQRMIERAISARLANHPEKYGKPLRNTLKGYRKLRVGDYRVVFAVVDLEVRILCIGHRKAVYRVVQARL